MLSGKLDKKISILNPVVVQSTASGSQTVTWSTYISDRWAKVDAVTLRDAFRSNIDAQLVAHNVTIRHTTGLNVNMRIVYDGSTYMIQSMREYDDRVEFTTMRLST